MGRRNGVQKSLSVSNIIYVGRSAINIKYIIHYKIQPMRKDNSIFRKWRNIDDIFIKYIDTALVRRYRVPVASFVLKLSNISYIRQLSANCPIQLWTNEI